MGGATEPVEIFNYWFCEIITRLHFFWHLKRQTQQFIFIMERVSALGNSLTCKCLTNSQEAVELIIIVKK